MKIIKPQLYKSKFFEDKRGALIKNFSQEKKDFIQNFKDSYISISKKNVFRGLHYQKEPYLQEKFFTIIRGEINFYCINIKNQNDYLCFNMSHKKHFSLYVPKGWATGFHSLTNESIVYFSSNQKYKQESQVNIDYKSISELKDKKLITLDDYN